MICGATYRQYQFILNSQRLKIVLTGLSAIPQYRCATCSVRVPIIWLAADWEFIRNTIWFCQRNRYDDSFHLCSTSLNVYRNNNYTCQLHSRRKKFKRRHFEIFFGFVPKNRVRHFMQTVSFETVSTFHANCLLRDSLHEMSNPVFWKKKSNCCLLNLHWAW